MSDNQTELKPGDIAEIKSGGKPMTILDIGKHTGLVWCRWMSDDGSVVDGIFGSNALRHSQRFAAMAVSLVLTRASGKNEYSLTAIPSNQMRATFSSVLLNPATVIERPPDGNETTSPILKSVFTESP